MLILRLVKTQNIGDKWGKKNIIYHALTEDELDDLYNTQSDYTYIGGWDFTIEELGDVNIPSI